MLPNQGAREDDALALPWFSEREPSMLLPEGPPSDAIDGLLNQWLMNAVQPGATLMLVQTVRVKLSKATGVSRRKLPHQICMNDRLLQTGQAKLMHSLPKRS